MRSFTQSDIFESLCKVAPLKTKMTAILDGKARPIILNQNLSGDLKTMQKLFKETVVLQAANAVQRGEIILVKLTPEFNLPDAIPFFKYKKNGQAKVIVNLTKYLIETPDNDAGDIVYQMDPKKLCAMIVPAYVTLKCFDTESGAVGLPPDVLRYSAILWARMFNKVLIRAASINSSPDRYEAFMYLAIKFFLKYYMDADDALANDIADHFLKNGKTYVIEYMEAKIEELNLHPYDSFVDFCTTIFNHEVSQIKGMKIGGINEKINVSFYLRNFKNMYQETAYLALASYPYFFWSLYGGYLKANICNDRSLEDILTFDKKEMTKLLLGVFGLIK